MRTDTPRPAEAVFAKENFDVSRNSYILRPCKIAGPHDWRGLNPEWLTPEWVLVLVLVVLVVVLVVLAVVSS